MTGQIYYNSKNVFGEKITVNLSDVNPEDHKELALFKALAPIFERHAQELRREIGQTLKDLGYEEE